MPRVLQESDGLLVADGQYLPTRLSQDLLDQEQLAHVHHQLSALTGLRWALVREGLHANGCWAVLESIQLNTGIDVQIVVETGTDLLLQLLKYP